MAPKKLSSDSDDFDHRHALEAYNDAELEEKFDFSGELANICAESTSIFFQDVRTLSWYSQHALLEELDTRRDRSYVDHIVSTPLFDAIESRNWTGILYFFQTGLFSSSPFALKQTLAASLPDVQAKIWIVGSNQKWYQLPIHAAATMHAPLAVVRALVKAYPDSLRCTDNDENLALHLAFKFDAPTDVINFLIRTFPLALQCRNRRGLTPVKCCSLNPDETVQAKGFIVETITTFLENRASEDCQSVKMALFEMKKKRAHAAMRLLLAKNDLKLEVIECVLRKHPSRNRSTSSSKDREKILREGKRLQEKRRHLLVAKANLNAGLLSRAHDDLMLASKKV